MPKQQTNDGGGNEPTPLRRGTTAVTAIGALLRDGLGLEDENNSDDPGAEGLADEEGTELDGSEGEPGGESRPRKGVPKDLDELAERLGVEVEELYGVELTLGGKGKRVKLSELKDSASSAADLEARELEFEESRIERENALLRERQELDWAIAQMPATDPRFKAVRDRAAAELKKMRDGAERAMLDTIREWKDPAVRTRELDELNAFVQQYGFDAGSIGRIHDPKLMKLLRDSMLREQRIRAALQQTKGRAPRPAASENPPQRRTPDDGKPRQPKTAHQAARETRTRLGQVIRNGR